MPKRRAKKATKQCASSPPIKVQRHADPKELSKEDEFTDIDHEVERQIAAIRTIRDVEIEQLLTALCLLRSNISQEHLQTPLQQYFEENLRNVVVITDEKAGSCLLKRKDEYGDLFLNTAGGRYLVTSFLHHMSMAFPDNTAAVQSFCDFELSSEAGRNEMKRSLKTSYFGADNLQIKDFVLEEPSDTRILGMQDSLQTPGASSQRCSVGMAPKTLRVPRHGEMLLSVHGSPLGVYNVDNMDAIQEMEEE